jgi:hypothetical protein
LRLVQRRLRFLLRGFVVMTVAFFFALQRLEDFR